MQTRHTHKYATALTITTNVLFLLLVSYLYFSTGDNGLTLSQLLGSDSISDVQRVIAIEIRLPRLLAAVAAGAILAHSGVIMQSLFRNPMVEPYTMGISGGAVCGVALAFILGLVAAFGSWALVLAAAAGAVLSVLLVLILRRAVGFDINATLLCGIMISFIASAVTTVLLSLDTHENMTQVVAWTIGSFDNVNPHLARPLAVISLLLVVLSPFIGNMLNVLSLGDDEARSVGLDVNKVSITFFILSSVLSSFVVAVSGVIAFVGMVVPHIATYFYGSDRRITLSGAALLGALILSATDLLAKTIIAPRELPVGALTAVVGGICFIILAVRWRKME
ncbi:MAG: iron ABC transporter permease [Bacteroidales bacterium]|nr:iron ABC transporter permease [Bacteroidales bacterium]